MMKIQLINGILHHIRSRIHLYGSYLQVWYYIEILYLMGIFLVVYGKGMAFTWGILCAVLLSIHIIRFYFKNETSRRIQLLLMDLHVPYAVSLSLALFWGDGNGHPVEIAISMIRFLVIAIELFMIWMLTDKKIKNDFDGFSQKIVN